jgi:CubicO group peptidase (beta-lactamase class C family)
MPPFSNFRATDPSVVRRAMSNFMMLSLMSMLGSAVNAAVATAPPATLAELDQRLAQSFVQRGIPGAALAVIEDGKVVLLKGYGVADKSKGTKVTPDTVFRAASISKSLTGIALMTLVEQGKLRLDDRLGDLAPEVKFINRWEQTDPVRLVHLLEHTTGWPDISVRVETTDGPGWTLRQGVQFTSPEFVSRWKPGQLAVYSNAGPAVAGYVLEKASGQDFSAFERDHVLRPMGMVSADFDLTPGLADSLAKSYSASGAETPYQHIILPPSGALATSVRDLSKLVLFFIGHGSIGEQQILSPQSVARIESSQASLAGKAGLSNGYGLGNFPLADQGPAYRGHNGQIDSFTSIYGYSAAQRSGYVVLANGGEGVDFKTPITRLIQGYLSRGRGITPPPVFPVAQRELDALAGFYRNVTPAKDLMRPYAELLGYSRVVAGSGKLVIGGRDYLPTGPHTFRRADRDQASLAFAEQDGDTYLLSGGLGDRKKEPGWHIVAYAATGGLALLGGLGALLALPFWAVAAFRKKLAAKGGWPIRLLPLLAVASCLTTLALPLISLESGMEAQLAAPSALSLTIFASSALFPAMAAGGLWQAWRNQSAGRLVRWHAGLTCGAMLLIALYALSISWVGVRVWHM